MMPSKNKCPSNNTDSDNLSSLPRKSKFVLIEAPNHYRLQKGASDKTSSQNSTLHRACYSLAVTLLVTITTINFSNINIRHQLSALLRSFLSPFILPHLTPFNRIVDLPILATKRWKFYSALLQPTTQPLTSQDALVARAKFKSCHCKIIGSGPTSSLNSIMVMNKM
jgi:hypothetical protein